MINVDYILSLQKEDNGHLKVEKVQIPHATQILNRLSSFENSNYSSIFDVVAYVAELDLNIRAKYSYCWPYEYRDSFIGPAQVTPYYREMNGKPVSIDIDVSKWRKDYEHELDSIKHRIELSYAAKKFVAKKPMVYMDKNEYILWLSRQKEEWLSRQKEEMRKEIEQAQKDFKEETKNKYVTHIKRCLLARDYTETLSSIKPQSLMYSSESIGWYNPNYTITDNVLVSVRTNFCYGRSAYFHVNLNYKGINILPYTNIVIYFWSNMMDNVRYTRDYYPLRSNWKEAFDFVVEVSNLIIDDSEKFEKEWIIDQVEKMMDGLKSINEEIGKYYERQKEAKIRYKEQEEAAQREGRELPNTIRYRFVDDRTIKNHKIYEHETLLIIQVDKLTAALSLLDDLTAIQNIYSPILKHIDTIVQYNELLIPAISQCRDDLQKRLEKLNKLLKELQEEQASVFNEMQRIRSEINDNLEKTDTIYQQMTTSHPQKQNMLNKACENSKEYNAARNEYGNLMDKINNVQQEIRDREEFDRHLLERSNYIRKVLNERKQQQ